MSCVYCTSTCTVYCICNVHSGLTITWLASQKKIGHQDHARGSFSLFRIPLKLDLSAQVIFIYCHQPFWGKYPPNICKVIKYFYQCPKTMKSISKWHGVANSQDIGFYKIIIYFIQEIFKNFPEASSPGLYNTRIILTLNIPFISRTKNFIYCTL